MFLQVRDYRPQIKGDILEALTRESPEILDSAEIAAISELSSYLRLRYDCAAIFAPITTWNDTGVYKQGGRIAHEGNLYHVITAQTTAGSAPPSTPTEYAAGDTRNAHIVKIVVDILLYDLHSRVAGRQIPEIRIARYEAALEWAKAVGAGKIAADLPAYPQDTAPTQDPIWRSEPRRSLRW